MHSVYFSRKLKLKNIIYVQNWRFDFGSGYDFKQNGNNLEQIYPHKISIDDFKPNQTIAAGPTSFLNWFYVMLLIFAGQPIKLAEGNNLKHVSKIFDPNIQPLLWLMLMEYI